MSPPDQIRQVTQAHPLLARRQTTINVENIQNGVNRFQDEVSSNRQVILQQAETYRDNRYAMLLNGHSDHYSQLMNHAGQFSEPEQVRRFNEVMTQVEAGNLQSYQGAIRWLTALIGTRIEDPARHEQAQDYLSQLNRTLLSFRRELQNDPTLTARHKFRQLHSAARVARTVLGILHEHADFVESYPGAAGQEQILIRSLANILQQLEDIYQGIHDDGETHADLLPLLHDIRMRRALLQGDASTARSYAFNLAQYVSTLPEEIPEDHEERWVYMTLMETCEDGLLQDQVQELHRTSDAEIVQFMTNQLASQLTQSMAATLDHVNEEEEAVIQVRYQAFSLVANALIQTHPGYTFREILALLRNPTQEGHVRQELENAGRFNPGLPEIQAQVEQALTDALENHPEAQTALAERLQLPNHDEMPEEARWRPNDIYLWAREAALHIQEFHEGPGHGAIEMVLREVELESYNQIPRLVRALSRHPQIVTELELAEDPQDFRAAALELLRSGPEAMDTVENYAQRFRRESVQNHQLRNQVIAIRRAMGPIPTGDETQDQVQLAQFAPVAVMNTHATRLLEYFQGEMRNQPDHVTATTQAALSFFAQLEGFGEEIPFSPDARAAAQGFSEEMGSPAFQLTDRLPYHVFRPGMVLELGVGALVPEIAMGRMLSRARSAGGAYRFIFPLVESNQLTRSAQILAGLGSGLGLSTVSTALQHYNRSENGLYTDAEMMGRDWGVSAGLNSLVFMGTVPFHRWLAGRLAPAMPGRGNTRFVGQMGFGRQALLATGTGLWGTALATGLPATYQSIEQQEWVAPTLAQGVENFVYLLAFAGATGFINRWRTRIGVAAEGRGGRVVEPLTWEQTRTSLEEINGRPFLPRLAPEGSPPGLLEGAYNHWTRFLAGRINEFFTVNARPQGMSIVESSGREIPISDYVDAMIEANPNLEGLRPHLIYLLTLREAVSPGSTERTFGRRGPEGPDGTPGRFPIFDGRFPTMNYEGGIPRLQFQVEGAQTVPRLRSLSIELVHAIENHLQNSAPAHDQATLLSEINGETGQVLNIYIDPHTHKVLSINGPRPELVPNAIQVEVSVDPASRRIILPRLGRELVHERWDGDFVDALEGLYREGESEVVTESLTQIQEALDAIRGTAQVDLFVGTQYGEVRIAPRGQTPANLPEQFIRLRGQYQADQGTVTLPPTRGSQSEVVLDLHSLRITRRPQSLESVEHESSSQRWDADFLESLELAYSSFHDPAVRRESLTHIEEATQVMGSSALLDVFIGTEHGEVRIAPRGQVPADLPAEYVQLEGSYQANQGTITLPPVRGQNELIILDLHNLQIRRQPAFVEYGPALDYIDSALAQRGGDSHQPAQLGETIPFGWNQGFLNRLMDFIGSPRENILHEVRENGRTLETSQRERSQAFTKARLNFYRMQEAYRHYWNQLRRQILENTSLERFQELAEQNASRRPRGFNEYLDSLRTEEGESAPNLENIESFLFGEFQQQRNNLEEGETLRMQDYQARVREYVEFLGTLQEQAIEFNDIRQLASRFRRPPNRPPHFMQFLRSLEENASLRWADHAEAAERFLRERLPEEEVQLMVTSDTMQLAVLDPSQPQFAHHETGMIVRARFNPENGTLRLPPAHDGHRAMILDLESWQIRYETMLDNPDLVPREWNRYVANRVRQAAESSNNDVRNQVLGNIPEILSPDQPSREVHLRLRLEDHTLEIVEPNYEVEAGQEILLSGRYEDGVITLPMPHHGGEPMLINL